MITEDQLQEWEGLASNTSNYECPLPAEDGNLVDVGWFLSFEAIPALIAEVRRMKAREQHATELINAGVDLMTVEQLGKWASVRTYLELTSDDYL